MPKFPHQRLRGARLENCSLLCVAVVAVVGYGYPASRSSRPSLGLSVSEGGARPSALRAPRPALRGVARCGRPAPRSVTCFAPSVVWAPLPLWSCRRCPSSMVAPSVFVCCGCPRFHISASGCPLPPSFIGRNAFDIWSCGLFRPCGAVALVGLLRRERPARHKARPCRALPTVGTAVPYGGFFSASAVCSELMPDGFPLSRRLARFAPSGIISNARHVHTFFDHRGAMGFVGVVLGASHLRHSRGLASSPRTLGAPTRGAFFRGCSLPHPRAPWLVFFIVVMLTPVRGLIPQSA